MRRIIECINLELVFPGEDKNELCASGETILQFHRLRFGTSKVRVESGDGIFIVQSHWGLKKCASITSLQNDEIVAFYSGSRLGRVGKLSISTDIELEWTAILETRIWVLRDQAHQVVLSVKGMPTELIPRFQVIIDPTFALIPKYKEAMHLLVMMLIYLLWYAFPF